MATLEEIQSALEADLLELRCIRYLSAIDDLPHRVYVGQLLFGKRYFKEVHPRTIEVD